MATRQKTPEERADVIEKANAKARKGYKTNLDVNRKGLKPDEIVVLEDMLVSLRVVGYSNSQCAAIVGLSKGQVKTIVQAEAFQKRLADIKRKLPEAAISLGKAYLVEAVQSIVHVMRTEKDSALVLKAASELLDRFGIPKSSRAEITNDKPDGGGEGFVGDPFMAKLRSAPPEIQEKVAELHEAFANGVETILNGGVENGDANAAG